MNEAKTCAACRCSPNYASSRPSAASSTTLPCCAHRTRNAWMPCSMRSARSTACCARRRRCCWRCGWIAWLEQRRASAHLRHGQMGLTVNALCLRPWQPKSASSPRTPLYFSPDRGVQHAPSCKKYLLVLICQPKEIAIRHRARGRPRPFAALLIQLAHRLGYRCPCVDAKSNANRQSANDDKKSLSYCNRPWTLATRGVGWCDERLRVETKHSIVMSDVNSSSRQRFAFAPTSPFFVGEQWRGLPMLL